MAHTLTGIFAALFRISTPILLAAMGGLFTHQVGIINIALEGFALFGSFFTIAFAYLLGNTWLGILLGDLATVVLALVFGLITIKYKANEIIAGLGIDVFASGITLFLLKAIFKTTGAFSSETIHPLPKISFSFLNAIPIIGPSINNHTPLVYIALLSIFVIHYFLFYTPLGLTFRGVGNNREAAKAAGINTQKISFIAVLLSGVFCGLAGAHLATGYVTMFSENMTAGRGFMAFIAILFGRGNPIAVSIVCLFFGFADSLSLRLQQVGLPPQLVLMIPYILAIVAITLSSAFQRKRHG